MTCDTYRRAVERAARYANARDGKLETAERFLARAGWADSTFGIESADLPGGGYFRYLNAGDTYALTVIQDGGTCYASTWGDWVETAEAEHCEDNDVIRCGHCSHFTPLDTDDWRDVVCESCENKVGG